MHHFDIHNFFWAWVMDEERQVESRNQQLPTVRKFAYQLHKGHELTQLSDQDPSTNS